MTPTKSATENSYGNARLSLPATTVKVNLPEEQELDFSTIDGGVIAYNAGTKAINNGAGIFIGDYFVGVSDCYQSIGNTPYIRY